MVKAVVKPAAKAASVKSAAAAKEVVAKTPATKKTSAKSPVVQDEKKGLAKLLKPSAHLAAVIGKVPVARTDAVKLIWEYIKANNLQNPKNKRNILADAKLKLVFDGKPEITMFEMTKFLSANLS